MKTKIISVGKLTINTIVTDGDILRDLNERDPLRVIGLKATQLEDAPAITVTFAGVITHKDTYGLLFALEVKDDD